LAQQNVLFEKNSYDELERNLAFDVANQWLSTWVLRAKLDLFLDAMQNIDSLVKINELRLKNLVITQTDLVRTRLVAEQYNLQIRNVTQSYQNELKKLKFLMGKSDSVALDATDPAEPIAVQDLTLDSLISMGQRLRTDVRSAQSAIDVSETNIKLQKAQAYPVPELGMIWNPQNTVPYLGFFGTVQVPIFSRNQGEIARSELVRKQAEQGLQTLQSRIATEILTSYQSYRTQRENLAKYESILTQSEAVLNSVRYAYLKGGTTIVDFLEAQRTWFDTRQIYYDAAISYRRSYFELLFSTGLINQLYE
jgi:cobalt-zinc-cadmium efflux system outer membrane protein